MTETTVTREELVARARRVLAGGTIGGYSLPPDRQIVVARGKGGRLYSTDGREFVDYLLGSGPMIHGHAYPPIVEAVRRQIELGTNFYLTHVPAVELAELLVEAIPCAEKVKYVGTGTEATYHALRIARAHTGRDLVMKFEGGFHGMHEYALMSWRPNRVVEFPAAQPDGAGAPRAVQETVLVAPWNNLERTREIVERHAGQIAALILEPYQRLYGPNPGFLEGLRELTRQHGIVMIFDEVVTGFRMAWGGGQEYYGVVPDMATYGKTIAGGYPLAAVCGTAEVMAPAEAAENESLLRREVIISGTFSGNPVAAVAGTVALQELAKPGVYQRLRAAGERVRSGIQEILVRRGVAGQVVGFGPTFHLLFTDEPVVDYWSAARSSKALEERLRIGAFDHGVLLHPNRSYISTVHTEEDFARTMEAFDAVLAGF